jgi:hypothetical protein
VHIVASERVRRARYEARDISSEEFIRADRQPVEAEIDLLGEQASTTIVNERDVEDLRSAARTIARQLASR